MNRQELDALLARHGLTITGLHEGAGKFVDLYVIAATFAPLVAAKKELEANGLGLVTLGAVDNPEHADYRKPMLTIGSWWNE